MSSPNPFQTFAHCWRYALRRALADGDTFHVVATGLPGAPRAVLSDRELFTRDELTPDDVRLRRTHSCPAGPPNPVARDLALIETLRAERERRAADRHLLSSPNGRHPHGP